MYQPLIKSSLSQSNKHNFCKQIQEMKFILISLVLILLTITYGVFGNSTISNKNNFANNNQANLNILNIVDIDSLKDSANTQKPATRFRRGCDCTTTTGRCVPYGNYQCYFSGGPSIVQCVNDNRWVTISPCDSSCKLFGNGQPYCS